MSHVGVVGAGVVGLSSALALLDAGHMVTLFDDDEGAQAPSWGNAGHIAAEQVAPLASLDTVRSVPSRLFCTGGALVLPPAQIAHWLPFSTRLLLASAPSRFARGRDAMRSLLAEAVPAWRALVERIGAPALLRDEGHYVAWYDAVTARKGTAAWQAADTGTAMPRSASAEELLRLGALGKKPLAGALRFSGTAQVADLDSLRRSLVEAVLAKGGVLRRGKAAIERQADRVQVVGHPTDQVLVCAGVHSRALLEGTGHKLPMIAERGYHVRADAAHWPEDLPPIAFEERAMIVTRYRESVQAASFVEFASPDAPADPRKWERLERHIAELGLPITGPFRRWMGARPTLPDYLPAIGRSSRAGNLFYACGHQHLGLTLAPITARIVTALVDGATPPVPVEAFDIDRFA